MEVVMNKDLVTNMIAARLANTKRERGDMAGFEKIRAHLEKRNIII